MHIVLSSAQIANLGIKLRWPFCMSMTYNLQMGTQQFNSSSHLPDEKGVSDKKFKSNHQTFSTGSVDSLA